MKYRILALMIMSIIFASQFTISEVEEAIEGIEYSRQTHITWRGRIMGEQTVRNETSFQEWMDSHKYVGSIEHHEYCIAKYDQVLSILYRLQAILKFLPSYISPEPS